jgi:hypothetical protein
MKIKITRWLLAAVLFTTTWLGFAQVTPLSAAASTTIHVVKYAADHTTVLNETTVSISTLESSKPVQGDGTTHYYTQGPTFDPDNLWDPNELCPNDSLKDKGALKGTAISDICSLVGGASSGDQINVKASDGYNETFQYSNVYNTLTDPDLNARQGKMVICWYKDGSYSGAGWTDGMLLAFFTEVARPSDSKLIFGHQDMHDCLPETNWHWYYQDSIQYPSTHGLSIKYINEISIYSGGTSEWSIPLSGAREDNLTQGWFENGLACHGASTYDDGAGNVWSGFALWYICGLVDDQNIHGAASFNDNLYYDIRVTGGIDNYDYTFSSTDIARNNYIFLANKLNGQAFSATYHPEYYPLKVVSSTFTNGGPSVAQINKIELLNISSTPPITPTPTPGVADWPLQLVGALSETMSSAQFQSGVDCHEPVTYTDEDNDTWSGMALWMLVGQIDDTNKHGAGSFNDTLAAANYQIKIYAADGYNYTFYSTDVARNNNIIVANKLNGDPLPLNTLSGDPPSSHPAYPLKITGPGTSSGSRIGAVVKIELIGLPSSSPAWDLNNDHVCNVSDIVILGLQWGMTGSPGFIPEDLNNDGVINVGDVVVLGRNWGKTW